MTEECVDSITFSESDIIKITRALGAYKTHGYDDILLRMIKLWANSVAHPHILMFQKSLVAGTFAI